MAAKLFYCYHPESDDIFISDFTSWLDMSHEVDMLGEVKERTLSELKSYEGAGKLNETFSDEELIVKLELITIGGKMVVNSVKHKLKQISRVYAYTDGSCYHKTRIGGIGVYMYTEIGGVTYESRVSRGYSNTKIGRMEMMAIIEAMSMIQPNKRDTTKLTIYCDSQYAVNCISKKWLWRWNLEGDLSKRTNGDLCVKMKELHDSFRPGNLIVKWVRGHDGNEGNEEADKLAGAGAKSVKHIPDTGYPS